MKEKLTPQHIFGYRSLPVLDHRPSDCISLCADQSVNSGISSGKILYQRQIMHQMMIRFLDKTYLFILGLAWIILMVVVEEYFRTGVKKGVLIQRFALVFGIEMLLIFIFDFSLWGLQNWMLATDRIFVLSFELLLGAGLLAYRSFTKKKKLTRRS
jgi:hypothetical protein